MTPRAVITGLIGAALIAIFGYINNYVIGLESLESGYLIPVIVVGGLIVFMITVNPLLFKIRPSLALKPSEAAVIVLMLLVALSIAGHSIMEQFTSVIALPGYWNRINPGWQNLGTREGSVLRITNNSCVDVVGGGNVLTRCRDH
jgi:hypothetical protein